METVEGNKLIAEFMGWQHHADEDFDEYEMNNLTYHKSWSWLMPVVEKIQKWYDESGDLYYEMRLEVIEKNEQDPLTIIEMRITESIKEVWAAVIQFITWYNTTKK